MGVQQVVVDQWLTRAAGAQVNGPAVRVDGQRVDVHFIGPVAQVASVEMSNDGHNWLPAIDLANVAITIINATSWFRAVRERPTFVRGILAAGGLGDYLFRWTILKDA